MVRQHQKDLALRFFDNTAKTYDKISFFATFGKDAYWKREIVAKMKNVDSVLDLACGTGILTRKIARKFPQSQILGVDISKSYLKIAAKNSSPISNILFLCCDVENLNLEKKFDCICSSYIPKYCNPEKLVNKIISHLNPIGKIILHDFTYPKHNLIRKLWDSYFVFLNFIGIFIPSWRYAFVELPKLIRQSNWVDLYKQELERNGFDVKLQKLTWDSSAILIAKR